MAEESSWAVRTGVPAVAEGVTAALPAEGYGLCALGQETGLFDLHRQADVLPTARE